MSYQVVLQSEAIVDIQTAFDWYELQRPGLGYEMTEEIEDGLERLSKHPNIILPPTKNTGSLELRDFLIWSFLRSKISKIW